ncbi:MAG: (2Fe-2S) ferredoxin domain-containing protein [Sporichthyaceae bacterium]
MKSPRPSSSGSADRFAGEGAPCRVSVCRGCCCGTRGRFPETDHQWQLDRFLAAAEVSGGRVAVRSTDCLGYCSAGNIVVVDPSPAGKDRGVKPVWLGFVLRDDRTEAVIEWVLAGGPGIVPMPEFVEMLVVTPPAELARSQKKSRPRSPVRSPIS